MNRIIIQNCNQCSLDLPLQLSNKLYKDFQIRHPNAFYVLKKMKRRPTSNQWDGYIKFISKKGTFKIGLLPEVLERCKKLGIDNIKVVDLRKPVPVVKKLIKRIGDYKLRPEQVKAVASVVNNKVAGVPFHIGVLDYTVNAGKTLVMAALYYSYKKKLKTLIITQDSDWFQQAKDEFKRYLPGEDITFIQGSKIFNWNNISIGMVQSLSRNISTYRNELAKVDMVLVDEADQGGSKTYQTVLTYLYNTRVRIGLSGTIYMSKLAKDRLKNMNLESYFGKKLAEFRLIDSIKKGYSTKTIVKMVPGDYYFGDWESSSTSYQDIYNDTITYNKKAYNAVLDRVNFNLKYNRTPALIVCKFIDHCENLYKYLKKSLDSNLKIAKVHVNTPTKERRSIMKNFRDGKIDILVSTTIIARGKNFPLLRLLINTASMDSREKSIQFLGRLVRTDSSKSRVYLDDIIFPGDYLRRHGNHRRTYYRKEKLKVIQLEVSNKYKP